MEMRRADKIAGLLEQALFSGQYQDGERLDEIKLAEQFKVSRTPIREALQVLVASGMAEQIPRRGVFVRQPGPVELMEMFETMAELEASCGRLETGLSQLVEANVKCQQAITDGDHDTYYLENEKFHQIIYRGAANSFLEKQALQLQNKLRAYRKMQLRFRGRMDQSMAEHLEIVAALQSEDADRAAHVLRSHVAVQGEKFHRLIASLKN